MSAPNRSPIPDDVPNGNDPPRKRPRIAPRRLPDALVLPVSSPALVVTIALAIAALGAALGRAPDDPSRGWALCIAGALCAIPLAAMAVAWDARRWLRRVAGALREEERRVLVRRLAPDGTIEEITPRSLAVGDTILVKMSGECPADCEIVEGAAVVDAPHLERPVPRRAGGVADLVEGTRILAGEIRARITSPPGQTLRRMAMLWLERLGIRPTPRERQISALLWLLTLPALACAAGMLACARLARVPSPTETACLLLFALSPLGAIVLLRPLALHARARLARRGLIPRDASAIEAAGSIHWIALDHDRSLECEPARPVEILAPSEGGRRQLLDAIRLCALADDVDVAPGLHELVAREDPRPRWDSFDPAQATFHPSGESRGQPFGVDRDGARIRIGPRTAIGALCKKPLPKTLEERVTRIERAGHAVWCVACDDAILGCVQMRARPRDGAPGLARRLVAAGFHLAVTSDRPGREARTVAETLGADDFLSDAKPENRLALVARHRRAGRTILARGAGEDDARILGEASVGVIAPARLPAPVAAARVLQLHGGSRRLMELATIALELQLARGATLGLALGALVAQCAILLPNAFALLYPVGVAHPDLLGFASAPRALAALALFQPISIPLFLLLARAGRDRDDPRVDRRWRINLARFALAGALLAIVGARAIDLLLSLLPLP